jgi:hypothetical protein
MRARNAAVFVLAGNNQQYTNILSLSASGNLLKKNNCGFMKRENSHHGCVIIILAQQIYI